ncbi:Hint domain-containing protein [Roseovarius sp. EL26]|uniref:Hint domain-containing protein n=1 Tax=Roseovarius sp. EL26 TaxID=2126672 RepID=UPI0020B13A0F|nr:Hint domain-containing protein [Roseovarius sp. EL26]
MVSATLFRYAAAQTGCREQLAFAHILRIGTALSPEIEMAIGESGSFVTDGSFDNPPTFTITLTEPLTDPVFAFSATGNGGDGFNLRLTNQTLDSDGNTTSFTVTLEEWEYLDGAHPAIETINWLAIEEGVHTLPDGRIIEAGTSTIGSTGQNTGGAETFSAGFTDPPVVLTSVMSNNDGTTVDSDPSNVTSTGFDLTLQEEEDEDGVHGAETIGWIAIQAGGDTTSGTASVSGDTVTHNTSTLGLGDTFTNGVVLAETQTVDGGDTAVVSIANQTGTTVSVYIDEEQSANSETNHTTEVVGIVAFEEGLIPCFTRGVQITVPDGTRLIEQLSVGDAVLTRGNGPQTIRWIGSRAYSLDALARNPKLRPIRIVAGALGNGLPERDLLVSRQHRMVVSSKIAERMFATHEVLIPAIRLTALPDIFVDEGVEAVEYFHLLFDRHEVIYAEGAPSESLFTGPEALKALNPKARAEIEAIFPEICEPDFVPSPARLIPENGKQIRKLVARHQRNCKPLFTKT